MTYQEIILRKLCIEIAKGEIGGQRFTDLLLQTGITLMDDEWETANRLLGQSTQLADLVEDPPPTC